MIGFEYKFKDKKGWKIEIVSEPTRKIIKDIFTNLRDLNYEYYDQYSDESIPTFNILIVKK